MGGPGVVGDVLSIDVGDGAVCFAQVCTDTFDVFLAGFEGVGDAGVPPGPEIWKRRICVFGAVVGDLVSVVADWPVVSRGPVPTFEELPFQACKLGLSPDWVVTDWDGRRGRPGTEEEGERLGYQRTWAPVSFKRALAAANGRGIWADFYADLLVPGDDRLAVVVMDGGLPSKRARARWVRAGEVLAGVTWAPAAPESEPVLVVEPAPSAVFVLSAADDAAALACGRWAEGLGLQTRVSPAHTVVAEWHEPLTVAEYQQLGQTIEDEAGRAGWEMLGSEYQLP